MTYIQHDGGGANRRTFFLSKFGSLDVSEARHQSWCRKGAHMPNQLPIQHHSQVGGGPGRGHGRGNWGHTETCHHLYDSRFYQILTHVGAVDAHTCSKLLQWLLLAQSQLDLAHSSAKWQAEQPGPVGEHADHVHVI